MTVRFFVIAFIWLCGNFIIISILNAKVGKKSYTDNTY